MVDTYKLKCKLLEKGISQATLAKQLGLVPRTFYTRIKKGVFTNLEIEKMAEILEIEDIMTIFFA